MGETTLRAMESGLPEHHMFDARESGLIKLGTVSADGFEFRLPGFRDVDNKRTVPTVVFRIKRKRCVNQMRNPVGLGSVKPSVPFGELGIKPRPFNHELRLMMIR